jgi:hypothetical protein
MEVMIEPSASLRIVRRVTRLHGARFAEAWLDLSMHAESLCNAFAAAGVVGWPDHYLDEGYTPEQERYHDIEKEILKETFTMMMPAIAAAFVKVATEVLARERGTLACRRGAVGGTKRSDSE